MKDISGNIFGDEKSRLERWAEHFQEPVNADSPEDQMSNIEQEETELDIYMNDLFLQKLQKAVKPLKNNKLTCYSNIIGEILETGCVGMRK